MRERFCARRTSWKWMTSPLVEYRNGTPYLPCHMKSARSPFEYRSAWVSTPCGPTVTFLASTTPRGRARGAVVTTLEEFNAMAARGHGIDGVLSTVRAGETIQSSLASAGVLHLVDGHRVLLREVYPATCRPRATVSARPGGTGPPSGATAQLIGARATATGYRSRAAARLPVREVFTAAAGTHDDWNECDRVMAARPAARSATRHLTRTAFD